MKKLTFLIAFCIALSLIGCGNANDAVAEKLLAERITISTEIARIVTDDPSISGVEKATKYFDERKANYFTLCNKVNKMKPGDMSSEVQKRYDVSFEKAYGEVFGRLSGLKSSPTWDDTAKDKYAELVADFKGVGKTDITKFQ